MTRSAHSRVRALAARLAALDSAAAPFTREIHVFDVVDSTNDLALRYVRAGAPEGCLVVADSQRRGRGRRGAAFESPVGGLYLSTYVRPAAALLPGIKDQPITGGLTLMAGVAVVEAARAHGAPRAELKWPNDVVVGDGRGRWRKLAGVLAEGAADEQGLQHVVLGLGVNVRETPPGLTDSAVSLAGCASREVAVADVAAAVVMSLAHWYGQLRRDGSPAIIDAWRRYAPSTTGRRVSWLHEGRRLHGIATGIDEGGGLQVDLGGRHARVVAGSVEWDGYGD